MRTTESVTIRLNGTGDHEPNNAVTTNSYFSKDGMRCWGGWKTKGNFIGWTTTYWDSENPIIYAGEGGTTEVDWEGDAKTRV